MVQDIYTKYFTEDCGVSTDTRTIVPGSIFIALKGERFNGNKYAQKALELGACVAIIDDPKYFKGNKTVLVKNSLSFLQDLANYHRKQLQAIIIGITGSNGKTTTKELIASVLGSKYQVICTHGNLNNHIGVPLTLLRLKKDTEFGIIEMGANHIGEIKLLSNIAEPDWGYITNVGKAHLEGFGSLEGVIQTKLELYDYLIQNNRFIFFNDKNSKLLNRIAGYKKAFTFQSDKSPLMLISHQSSPLLSLVARYNNDEIVINTKLTGRYNVDNVLSAIAIGIKAGINLSEIAKAIESYAPSNNRSQWSKTNWNEVLIDCYNANPSSMRAALEDFSQIQSEDKVLILGSLKELGQYSEKEHLKIIEMALQVNGMTKVLLIGDEYPKEKHQENMNISFFDNTESLIKFLKKERLQNKTILLKGSRLNKLEDALTFL